MQLPNPESRTLEVVQQEHNNVAFEVGIVNYQISCLNQKLDVLYPKMLALNEEGAKLMKEKNNGSQPTAPSQDAKSEAATNADPDNVPPIPVPEESNLQV